MDLIVECPVCTLYLRSGMNLEDHLDTHPKEQVIKALASISLMNATVGMKPEQIPQPQVQQQHPQLPLPLQTPTNALAAYSANCLLTPPASNSVTIVKRDPSIPSDIVISGAAPSTSGDIPEEHVISRVGMKVPGSSTLSILPRYTSERYSGPPPPYKSRRVQTLEPQSPAQQQAQSQPQVQQQAQSQPQALQQAQSQPQTLLQQQAKLQQPQQQQQAKLQQQQQQQQAKLQQQQQQQQAKLQQQQQQQQLQVPPQQHQPQQHQPQQHQPQQRSQPQQQQPQQQHQQQIHPQPQQQIHPQPQQLIHPQPQQLIQPQEQQQMQPQPLPQAQTQTEAQILGTATDGIVLQSVLPIVLTGLPAPHVDSPQAIPGRAVTIQRIENASIDATPVRKRPEDVRVLSDVKVTAPLAECYKDVILNLKAKKLPLNIGDNTSLIQPSLRRAVSSTDAELPLNDSVNELVINPKSGMPPINFDNVEAIEIRNHGDEDEEGGPNDTAGQCVRDATEHHRAFEDSVECYKRRKRRGESRCGGASKRVHSIAGARDCYTGNLSLNVKTASTASASSVAPGPTAKPSLTDQASSSYANAMVTSVIRKTPHPSSSPRQIVYRPAILNASASSVEVDSVGTPSSSSGTTTVCNTSSSSSGSFGSNYLVTRVEKDIGSAGGSCIEVLEILSSASSLSLESAASHASSCVEVPLSSVANPVVTVVAASASSSFESIETVCHGYTGGSAAHSISSNMRNSNNTINRHVVKARSQNTAEAMSTPATAIHSVAPKGVAAAQVGVPAQNESKVFSSFPTPRRIRQAAHMSTSRQQIANYDRAARALMLTRIRTGNRTIPTSQRLFASQLAELSPTLGDGDYKLRYVNNQGVKKEEQLRNPESDIIEFVKREGIAIENCKIIEGTTNLKESASGVARQNSSGKNDGQEQHDQPDCGDEELDGSDVDEQIPSDSEEDLKRFFGPEVDNMYTSVYNANWGVQGQFNESAAVSISKEETFDDSEEEEDEEEDEEDADDEDNGDEEEKGHDEDERPPDAGGRGGQVEPQNQDGERQQDQREQDRRGQSKRQQFKKEDGKEDEEMMPLDSSCAQQVKQEPDQVHEKLLPHASLECFEMVETTAVAEIEVESEEILPKPLEKCFSPDVDLEDGTAMSSVKDEAQCCPPSMGSQLENPCVLSTPGEVRDFFEAGPSSQKSGPCVFSGTSFKQEYGSNRPQANHFHADDKDYLEAGPSTRAVPPISDCTVGGAKASRTPTHRSAFQEYDWYRHSLSLQPSSASGATTPTEQDGIPLSWARKFSPQYSSAALAASGGLLDAGDDSAPDDEVEVRARGKEGSFRRSDGDFGEHDTSSSDEDVPLGETKAMDTTRGASDTCVSLDDNLDGGGSGRAGGVGEGDTASGCEIAKIEGSANRHSSVSSIGSNSLERAPSTESLNIRTDEKMPAKGEISEQESNGDMDMTSWNRLCAVSENIPVYPSSYDPSTAQECWNLSNRNLGNHCSFITGESGGGPPFFSKAGANYNSATHSYLSPRMPFPFSSGSQTLLSSYPSGGNAGPVECKNEENDELHDEDDEDEEDEEERERSGSMKRLIPKIRFDEMDVDNTGSRHQQQQLHSISSASFVDGMLEEKYSPETTAATHFVGVVSASRPISVEVQNATTTMAVMRTMSEPKPSGSGTARTYRCTSCPKAFSSIKQRREHQQQEHPGDVQLQHVAKKQRRQQQKQQHELEPQLLAACEFAEDSKEGILDKKPAPVRPLPVVMNYDWLRMEIQRKYELVSTPADKIDVSVPTVVHRRSFVCPICQLEFERFNQFNTHLSVHPAECLACGRYFKQWRNFTLHLKRHLGIKEHGCRVCGKHFVIKQKLIEHMRVHTGLAPIRCKLCNRHFKRFSNLAQHSNRYHLNKAVVKHEYVCSQCGDVFPTRAKMEWHKETHDQKPKPCPYCREKFIHQNSLTRHIRLSHTEKYAKLENKTEPCTVCQQPYTKASMRRHMETHAEGRLVFSCSICNKHFTTNWNLKQHKWTHANPTMKPFQCTICPTGFVRESDYLTHVNSHRSIRPYTCNHCGRQFIRKYNWLRHSREHETDKGHNCEVCGRQFHRKYYLTEHKRIHTGERPYACNICGKTSSTKTNHNKHVRIHHARDPLTAEG